MTHISLMVVLTTGTVLADAEPPELRQTIDFLLQRFDTDKDGKISRQEAQGPFRDNFAKADTNGDGFLDRTELMVVARRIRAFGSGGFRPVGPDFDAFDRDADGRLTRDELRGTPFADLFDQIDTNKDGTLQRKEFVEHFRKNPPAPN
ncbi:MAG: EF-hand domain-containing protein [Gemmataceae bacterium]|nr:EF-hand domain-containing protein [Gemmataceae bacterium]MDW8266623.1 EF-hand domain-containing protein [Gemmataceae bacterium]